jgi:hypothetical protein
MVKSAGAVASFDVGVAFRKGGKDSVALLNKSLWFAWSIQPRPWPVCLGRILVLVFSGRCV